MKSYDANAQSYIQELITKVDLLEAENEELRELTKVQKAQILGLLQDRRYPDLKAG